MATYRLELDEHGEPLLIEESNCVSPTPIDQWIERYLTGVTDVPTPAANDPHSDSGGAALLPIPSYLSLTTAGCPE